MKYCRNCGTKLRDEANFCYQCGESCAKIEFQEDEKEVIKDEIPSEEEAVSETELSEADEDEIDDDFDDVEADDDSDDPDEDEDEDEDEDIDFDDPYARRRAELRRPKRRRKKKKSSKAGLVVFCLIVAVLASYVAWSPARRTVTYVMYGYPEDAQQLYETRIAGNPVEDRLLRVIGGIETVYIFNAYNSGKLSFESAEAYLKDLVPYSDAATWKLNQLRTLKPSKEAFALAERYRTEGDLRSAVKAYDHVLPEDKNSKRAAEGRTEAAALYRDQVLAEAASKVSEGDYPAALAALETGAETLPDDMIISDRIKEVRLQYSSALKKEAVPVAKEYIEEGHYKQAIDLLTEAKKYNNDDQEITALIETAVTKYEDFVTEQVSIYIGNKDFDGAVGLISRALSDIPDNQTFIQLYKNVEQSRKSS